MPCLLDISAFLKSIGMENDVDVDDVSDVSFEETDNDHMTSPRAPADKDMEENTPRKSGILKNWTVSQGFFFLCIWSLLL